MDNEHRQGIYMTQKAQPFNTFFSSWQSGITVGVLYNRTCVAVSSMISELNNVGIYLKLQSSLTCLILFANKAIVQSGIVIGFKGTLKLHILTEPCTQLERSSVLQETK